MLGNYGNPSRRSRKIFFDTNRSTHIHECDERHHTESGKNLNSSPNNASRACRLQSVSLRASECEVRRKTLIAGHPDTRGRTPRPREHTRASGTPAVS
ncbi:hypothetical protein AVEN_194365-1 [Araneus ventricosus]|uniref:Uncharacterized protein n=1 Tax=Araneus ventricosus TaxID=182803 RepID=A0A4Y2GUU0_ARAVE|nr:hypothetical protein AVEN_194365-1 [Araneus ventricosus]